MNIQIQNLSFSFDSFGKPSAPVLNEINLKIAAGEFLALVGASGSGKTTLMQHLTGLLKPQKGRILVGGINIWDKGFDFSTLRRQIGLIFQFPETQLFEESVFKDIAFGPRNIGINEKEVSTVVKNALADVGLDFQEFKDRIPLHLSEGEKRRVAIAGVLAMKPDFLALDEPTAGMDYSGVKAITNVLQNYYKRGKTILLISHNLDFVNALAERIVVLKSGSIIFDGHKSDLFNNQKLLQNARLSVPRTKILLEKLKEKGLVNSANLFDIGEIKKALSQKISIQTTQKTLGN